MRKLLIAIVLSQVTPPASSGASGAVSGVVLSSSGVPAPAVRVYAIPAGAPDAAAAAGSVVESLAQTDASGRYRLEVPSGRYYIAAGSVDSPTYYPNDRSVASARVITVSAGTTVPDINFSRYIPASSGSPPPAITGLPPGSTGVLSGLIRNNDGSPASGIPVVAVPVSVMAAISASNGATLPASTISMIQSLSDGPASATSSLTARIRSAGGGIRALSDRTGRYRIEAVSPDTYYILAGFSDSPVFYPGSGDINAAARLTTTSTTMLDSLHFNLPSAKRVPVRIRVQGRDGTPAPGANVEVKITDRASAIGSFLPNRTYPTSTSGDDGFAEFLVADGKYSVTAKLPPALAVSKEIETRNQPLNADLAMPIYVVTGSVLFADGTPVNDPVVSQIAFRKTSNPGLTATTILQMSKDGKFKAVLEPGEYRTFIRNLPTPYQIDSMSSGPVDLATGSLKLDGDRPANVQIRLSPKTNAVVNVNGRITDVISGMPAAAARVQLCCFASGPFERLSADLLSDSSFQFSDVPAGRYEVELKGTTERIVEPTVEVVDQGQTTLRLLAAEQFANLVIGISTDGSIPRPQRANVSVTFTSTSGGTFHVTASGPVDEILTASVPAGIGYDVTLSGLPAAVKVKSLSGSNTPLQPSNSAGSAGVYNALNNASLMITLTRSD